MSVNAEVAVFGGLRAPPRTFTYRVPDGLELRPGHLVRVTLGPRPARGVVLSLGAPDAGELKEVLGLVHPLPLLGPAQLALARWIAGRYRAGLADAVRAMLPPALSARAALALPEAKGERSEAVYALAP
ncbi:MAG TPA: hypothetical protein VMJ92_03935, partial [Candidatus Limnocylindrales bacterium]|nr:hypothetical protein [Candidatus Limnocylindrales bacterium]